MTQRRPHGLSISYANPAERLLELVHDKSTLSLPLVNKDNWIKNEQRPQCYFCERTFHPPFVRKHHCRGCGEVVCRNCHRYRRVRAMPTPLHVRNVRLCFDCIDKALVDTTAKRCERGDVQHGENDDDDSVETPDSDFLRPSRYASSSSSTDGTASIVIASSAITSSAHLTSLERSLCASYSSSSSNSSSNSTTDVDESDSWSDRSTSTSSDTSSTHPHQVSPAAHSQPPHEHYAPLGTLDSALPRALRDPIRRVDADRQPALDALCELASKALACSVAAISVFDRTQQSFLARIGIAPRALPRAVAFCTQVFRDTNASNDGATALPMVVLDATRDRRFATNPLVTGSAHIRFFATTPVRDPSTGRIVGSVFVMDTTPKHALPERAMEILAYLSTATGQLLFHDTKDRQSRSQQHQQQQQQSAHEHKRKRRVHSAPAMPAASSNNDRPSQRLRARADGRAASLQCVPEEFEAIDDSTLRYVHTVPRRTQERALYELIDPGVLLPSTPTQRSSERHTAAAAGRLAPTSPQAMRHTTAGLSFARMQRQSDAPCVHLSSSNSRDSSDSRDGSDSSDEDDGDSDAGRCSELLRRISSTQQLLAQQQSEYLAALSTRSSSFDSLESAMRRISTGRSGASRHASTLHRDINIEIEV